MRKRFDGHVHSPFCPHGTTDSFEQYIEQALKYNYNEISFTEHAPLPKTFVDPVPEKDSAMNYFDLEDYITSIQHLKESYRDDIKINLGLEIDYIEGYEEEIQHFLNEYGPQLDDSILSVHFLQLKNHYYCLDYSEIGFKEIVTVAGSLDHVYNLYFDTVLKSITSSLGTFKPKRIGHVTLVHKFKKMFPTELTYNQKLLHILNEIKNQNLQLDYNGAGMVKPNCQEPYPPNWVIEEAVKRNIPLVYGSDAHSAKGLMQGYDVLLYKDKLKPPTIT
jgi:histidinol-phosphatase (PHP family)